MSKKALCVGINNFKNYAGSALQGCINDANDMAGILQEFMGFTSADITVLTDEQATKINIISELQVMVAGARDGKYDHLVFSLSSHGTQVPDLEEDETDYYDEAFCPYDLVQNGDHWDRDHIIIDDELHQLFGGLPANVLLEVYLDTCYSGTGLKVMDLLIDRKPRFLPPPTAAGLLEVEGRIPRAGTTSLRGIHTKANIILWAGCRANQTSSDARIDSSWHGAFTYYFVKELSTCENRLSRTEILKKVRVQLKAGHYTQVPQLEGKTALKKLFCGHEK
jgi:hypothetical protein